MGWGLGCILPLLCSLAVRGGCFVAIVVVLIVAVPLCRLAFFLIAVMLNLFQHPVAFKKTKLSTNYITHTGYDSSCNKTADPETSSG